MDYGLAKGVKSKEGAEAAAEIIGIMFMSRTYAHMAHLKTPSFAAHKALDGFYDCIVSLADKFAEAAQGKYGILDIPAMPVHGNVDKPIPTLKMHMEDICRVGSGFSGAIGNIRDEIEGLYLQTLYLLKELS